MKFPARWWWVYLLLWPGVGQADFHAITLDESRIGARTVSGGTINFNFGSGDFFATVRSDLLNPTRFGSNGTVGPSSWTLLPAIPALTPEALVDADLVIWGSSVTLCYEELAVLQAFVQKGGHVMVFANSVVEEGAFAGATYGNYSSTGLSSVSNPSSPLISGPFGNVTTMNTGAAGAFSSLGSGGREAMRNDQGISVADWTVGAGRMVLFTDEEIFGEKGVSGLAAAHLTANTRILFSNAISLLTPPDSDANGIPDGRQNTPLVSYTYDPVLDAATQTPFCVDVDEDGWPGILECDDSDPFIYPGADEHCDGVDEDCDGNVDEDAVDMATYYLDEDGDGYGDTQSAQLSCEGDGGFVVVGGDCDDLAVDAYPGAEENADGDDQDCDGQIDEGTTPVPTPTPVPSPTFAPSPTPTEPPLLSPTSLIEPTPTAEIAPTPTRVPTSTAEISPTPTKEPTPTTGTTTPEAPTQVGNPTDSFPTEISSTPEHSPTITPSPEPDLTPLYTWAPTPISTPIPEPTDGEVTEETPTTAPTPFEPEQSPTPIQSPPLADTEAPPSPTPTPENTSPLDLSPTPHPIDAVASGGGGCSQEGGRQETGLGGILLFLAVLCQPTRNKRRL